MNARAFRSRRLGAAVTVRPLRDGDTATVAALFERLGERSRALRFHGAKPRLTDGDLALLAAVDGDRHVLVAYVDGDPAPAALARLARDRDDPRAAEIAFEVADRYHRAGIGTALVGLLLADARAAGFAHVDAYVEPSNRPALALLRRVLGRPDARIEDGCVAVRAPLRGCRAAPARARSPRTAP